MVANDNTQSPREDNTNTNTNTKDDNNSSTSTSTTNGQHTHSVSLEGKLILVGETSVGKTSIMARFCNKGEWVSEWVNQ